MVSFPQTVPWIAYDVRRVNGNNELRYRAVATGFYTHRGLR